MHLSTLSITDVRQFEERVFDFSPGFNLLIGENGAGKTTIIRALLAALGGANQTGPYPKFEDEDIRLDRRQAKVKAKVHGFRRNAVTFQYSKRLWELGARSHTRKERPLVLSYASNEATCSSMNERSAKRIHGLRGFDSRRAEEFLYYNTERTASSRMSGQTSLSFGNSYRVRDFLGTVLSTFSPDFQEFYWRFEPYDCALVIPPSEDEKRVSDKDTEKMIRSAALRYFQENRIGSGRKPYDWPDQPLVTLLPGGTKEINEKSHLPDPRDIWEQMSLELPPAYQEILHETSLEVYLTPRIKIRREIGLLSLNQLSDGEQRLFSLFVDIARELSLRAEAGVGIGDGKAIVLIDEIDVHLHPKWQRQIVPLLEELFPSCQFIATTHSPFVIQSMRKGQLISLDGKIEAEYANQNIEDVAEDIMGVEIPQRSARYVEMMEVASQYYRALSDAEQDSEVDVLELKMKLDAMSVRYSSDPFFAANLEFQWETFLAKKEIAES